jgi:F-type H+-transporting ATPase subunit a
VGLFIKHAVLAVRLLANMVAGHLVLLGIMGIIIASAEASHGMWATAAVVSVLGSTLFSCLELFVAFLQAYVFTFLSALFISAAVHHH